MAYNDLGKHCRHFAQLGHCHYGNSCKFLHERGPDYQPTDRSHRNYHSSSDRNSSSNNFKITIQNQSSSSRHSYSRSKSDRDIKAYRDRERERDRERVRASDRSNRDRDTHRDRDRDRERERDNKSKYSGAKRSRDEFEKKPSDRDKSGYNKEKDTKVIKDRSATKKVPEPPTKKLRRISRNDDKEDRESIKESEKESISHNKYKEICTTSSVTTRKLRRIVRKPNESEMNQHIAINVENEDKKKEKHPRKEKKERVDLSAPQLSHITETNRKRKIVRNSDINGNNANNTESEKEKIAEIIKEAQSQRIYKEKVKKLEADEAKAKVVAALNALVLPPTPAILQSPKEVQHTIKPVAKSVKHVKEKESKKRRRRDKERKYKRRRRRSESSVESSSSYESEYSSSESESDSDSLSSNESESDNIKPVEKKLKDVIGDKQSGMEQNVKVEQSKGGKPEMMAQKVEEIETKMNVEIEEEEKDENEHKDKEKKVEIKNEIKVKKRLNVDGMSMIEKYLNVSSDLLGETLGNMLRDKVRIDGNENECFETTMKGTHCDDSVQRYYLILNSGHFV